MFKLVRTEYNVFSNESLRRQRVAKEKETAEREAVYRRRSNEIRDAWSERYGTKSQKVPSWKSPEAEKKHQEKLRKIREYKRK